MVNYTIFDEPVLIEITQSSGVVINLSDVCRLDLGEEQIKIYQMYGVTWIMPRSGCSIKVL